MTGGQIESKSARRAAIPKVENNAKTHLSLTKKLFIKYNKGYKRKNNELESINDPSNWLKKGNLRLRDKAVISYIQDIEDGVCQHCSKSGKTVDHLASRCEKRLDHNNTIRHNEVLQCINLLLLNRYHFESSKQIRSHSVQKILDNEQPTLPLKQVDNDEDGVQKVNTKNISPFSLDSKTTAEEPAINSNG
ncbi:hypothetical protein CWI39_1380p0010 [Hamiltosporidium magnivora]|uniref:Reverse transcriptase n=1 Tax=Hamiltosporidium magnivora TaxID=148818 RepID=A0A4Q9L247_9MICR|nr:hypothetical protein CWI39_1380p0010 [Hamiltosporidium magnivora]